VSAFRVAIDEADAGAVRFYKKRGFICTSLGEKYPASIGSTSAGPRPATRTISDHHVQNDYRVRVTPEYQRD
jgi:hypothetical protein